MEQNQFTDEKIWQYCMENTSNLSSNLNKLTKETTANIHGAQMLSEKMVTKVLQFFTFSLNAKICVDVGTYTGMSAIAMAEASTADTIIFTIDKQNQAGEKLAHKFFKNYPKIKSIVADAIDVLHTLPNNIDIAFIDADKMQTKAYFDILIGKLSDRGIIIVDDTLWRGEVLEPKDKRAKALDDFNSYIVNREDIDNVILPIRHGINIIRKK